MLFSVILLVLILAMVMVQSSQGWYSAMIMSVLSVACAALAFGANDYVAVNFIAPYWKPSYAHAIALAALFGVPLIILRQLFDRTIRRTTLLPLLVDRAGGGICGFITAMIVVGVFAHAVSLLPFDRGSILGFSRVVVADPPSDTPATTTPRNLWFSPDRFAAGLGTMLTAGVFGSGTSLYQDHPDPVQEAAWTNAVPVGVSRYAAPGSISVVGSEVIAEVFRVEQPSDPKKGPPSYVPVGPSAGSEFRLVKVKLGDGARDERKSHLFTLRQFRIAGRKPGSASLTEYHAIGIQQEDASDPVNRYIRFKKGRNDLPVYDTVYSPRNRETVEVVFEVPTGFQATHVGYKRGAIAPLTGETTRSTSTERGSSPDAGTAPAAAPTGTTTGSAAAPSSPTTPPPSAPPAPASNTESRSASRRGGNIRGVTTKAGRSFFGDALPLELKSYRGTNIEESAGKLRSGGLVAELDQQGEGTDSPLRTFFVPDDQRLLQLSISKLQARSGLGRIISHAVGTVENYSVKDSRGNRYEVVGKYAVAKVNGTDVLELQYFGGAEAGVGRMRPFDRIKDTHLKDDYGFVLLFLVQPGATISSFSSGSEASREDDLTGENLTAPL